MDKFASRKQTVHWLQAQGYKISVPRIYKDVKKGLLIIEPDGTVRKEAVERYIKTAGLIQPAAETVKSSIHADKKQIEEIRAIELSNRKKELEIGILEKRYILRTDADAALGDLAAVADGIARMVIRSNIGAYLQRAGLDTSKAGEIAGWYAEDLDIALDQVVQDGGCWIEPEGETDG